MYTMV